MCERRSHEKNVAFAVTMNKTLTLTLEREKSIPLCACGGARWQLFRAYLDHADDDGARPFCESASRSP